MTTEQASPERDRTPVLPRVLELLVVRAGSEALVKHAQRPRGDYSGILARIEPGSHAQRVLARLGIEAPQAGPEHSLAAAATDALEHHGVALCGVSNPECSQCPLVSFCAQGRRNVAKAPEAPQLTVVDMFAGVGGLGRGFKEAGFTLVGAFERNREAAQTYRLNHPGVPVIEADVAALSAAEIRDWLVQERVDVLIAGPPCQGYSAAGKRSIDDERNFMFRHVVRIADELDVSAITIENVPGARTLGGDVSFADQIVSALLASGFKAKDETATLRASEFGVPQGRRRLFFLAARTGAPAPPTATHTRHGDDQRADAPRTPSVVDTLAGLPRVSAGGGAQRFREPGGEIVFNHQAMAHTESVQAKISTIAPGAGPLSYRRLHRDEARTLVAGHRALPVHPAENRTITVREAARLQGFPDDYVFCGSHASQPLQVANAVPPPLARAVALALKEHLMCRPDDR